MFRTVITIHKEEEIVYNFTEQQLSLGERDFMDASKPKWVNPDVILYGVNLFRLGGHHQFFYDLVAI